MKGFINIYGSQEKNCIKKTNATSKDTTLVILYKYENII